MSTLDEIRGCFVRDGFAYFDLAGYLPDVQEAAGNLGRIPEGAWSHIIRNREGEFEFPHDRLSEIARHQRMAEEDLKEGRFAFSFERLNDSIANAGVYEFHSMKRLLGSTAMSNVLCNVTARRPTRIVQFYISRFGRGHFISTHRDPGQSFGVAVNLTRGWDPNHGGLTVILDGECHTARACLVPTAFQMLVFDTSKRSTPHLVSMVSVSPPQARMAAIARYDAVPAE
ncbi:hypothetical protein [Stenotrophomonas rhizophila]|uniref:hypothetical protein n=1 Tax=Stenotrophomonas rhizophila TaxID=216778 RepID=UPI0028D0EEAC|nr:hypothetical protein [Stenotrophomonas rhizophila]